MPVRVKSQVALDDRIACFILYILSPKLANKVMFLACPQHIIAGAPSRLDSQSSFTAEVHGVDAAHRHKQNDGALFIADAPITDFPIRLSNSPQWCAITGKAKGIRDSHCRKAPAKRRPSNC